MACERTIRSQRKCSGQRGDTETLADKRIDESSVLWHAEPGFDGKAVQVHVRRGRGVRLRIPAQ